VRGERGEVRGEKGEVGVLLSEAKSRHCGRVLE